MPAPKISVALCTYNGAAWLGEQLDSILTQTWPVSEIVIGDDGSTDGTMDILEEYSSRYPGIFQIHQNPFRLGYGQNFWQTLQRCKGEYIFLADQDDVWLPEKTKYFLEAWEKEPDTLAFFCNASLLQAGKPANAAEDSGLWKMVYGSDDLANEVASETLFARLCLNHSFIYGATMAVRRSALPLLMARWSNAWPYHDYLLALRAGLYDGLHPIAHKLMYYRLHEQQTAGLEGVKQNQEQILFQRACWLDLPDISPAEKCRYFAFGLHAMERLKPELVFNEEEQALFRESYLLVETKFWQERKAFFGTMPFWPRKWKLLKHWLKGGEFVQIRFTDIFYL